MKIDPDLLDNAMVYLKPNYSKIMQVVVNDDTYVPIDIPMDEREKVLSGDIDKFSDYVLWFVTSKFIHSDDVIDFVNFMSTLDKDNHLLYRRKIDGDWHMVILETKPTLAYSESHKELLLFVRDIDNIFTRAYNRALSKIGSTDALTGLPNRVALLNDISSYNSKNVGIIFADVNGLKYTNDTYGHAAGDDLLIKFANLLNLNFSDCKCYHLSGDEFIVMTKDGSIREFINKAIIFHKSLWNSDSFPVASIGYSVGEASELQAVYNDAEKCMYDDKRMFYLKYPKFRRGYTEEVKSSNVDDKHIGNITNGWYNSSSNIDA